MTEQREQYATAPAPSGDRALIEALAERLMGWRWLNEADWANLSDGWYIDSGDTEVEFMAPPDWNPLTDPAAAAQVLDEIERRGWAWRQSHNARLGWYSALIYENLDDNPYIHMGNTKPLGKALVENDRYRALCQAAARACGWEG